MIERSTEYLRSGRQRTEIAYGLSSLSAAQATAARLLELNRGHWEIENRVHYVRDVSFDEDRCRIRTGSAARVMATIRNLIIRIFRLMGFQYISEGVRHFAMRLELALQLLGI